MITTCTYTHTHSNRFPFHSKLPTSCRPDSLGNKYIRPTDCELTATTKPQALATKCIVFNKLSAA